MDTDEKPLLKINNEAFFTMVKQRIDMGDQVWIPILGKSMEPFLHERDEVLLRAVEEKEIAIGDVVLARWGQRYVLHRVIRKAGHDLWLVGDNNLVQIEHVALTDVIAISCQARRAGNFIGVSGPWNKCLGILWYYLRLPRRVMVAIKRRF